MAVLKALKKFRYDKVKLRPGDMFKVKDRDVPILIGAQLATRPEAPMNPVYSTRDMVASPRVVEYDKLEAEAPDHSEMTVAELRAAVEAKGIELPSGYVPKAKLLDMLSA